MTVPGALDSSTFSPTSGQLFPAVRGKQTTHVRRLCVTSKGCKPQAAAVLFSPGPPHAQPNLAVGQTKQRSIRELSACLALPASLPARPVEGSGSNQYLKPLPRAVENVADDPSLHNPLQRMERLGTGWLGVIAELEGVVVEDSADAHRRAWMQLAEEEGKPQPLQFALKRAEGMKSEQAVEEVFCWTRNPVEVRRLANRKEVLYRAALGDRKPVVPSGVQKLLRTLNKHNVPVALVSAAPENRVTSTLAETGLSSEFETVVSAEDVYRGKPDPEGYLYAAQRMGRPAARCVVLGNSNQSVEAAHECGMQCVVVAGRMPIYELTAADLVVRQLDELSFVNLKQLFRLEESVLPPDAEPELEEEEQEESGFDTVTLTIDRW